MQAPDGKLQPPLLRRLFCLLVGLFLLCRVDLGPMQHVATLLAVLMALTWCSQWLVRRHRDDRQR